MTGYIISGLLIAIGIFFYIRYTKKYSKRFAHIGLCAAQTYIMFGDMSALCATRTVCASMSKFDKEQLLAMFKHIPVSGEGFDEQLATQRRSELITCTTLDKNGVVASGTFKIELNNLSKDWLQAVMKCDDLIANKLFRDAASQNIVKSLKKINENASKSIT
jgi:hypothetical protein